MCDEIAGRSRKCRNDVYAISVAQFIRSDRLSYKCYVSTKANLVNIELKPSLNTGVVVGYRDDIDEKEKKTNSLLAINTISVHNTSYTTLIEWLVSDETDETKR